MGATTIGMHRLDLRRLVLRGLGTGALILGLAVGGMLSVPLPAHAGETDDISWLVNQSRADNGLNGLVRNGSLDAVAAGWAAQLGQSGTLSHNPSYSAQIPGGWVAAAENVAQGYQGGTAMHNGWMNSSGHRANILGDFTDIGVAYLVAGGTTWGVEVFANYPGSGIPAAPPPPAPAPAPAADPAAEPLAVPAPAPVAAAPSSPAPTGAPTNAATRVATLPPTARPSSSATGLPGSDSRDRDPVALTALGSEKVGGGSGDVQAAIFGATLSALTGAGLLSAVFVLRRRSILAAGPSRDNQAERSEQS